MEKNLTTKITELGENFLDFIIGIHGFLAQSEKGLPENICHRINDVYGELNDFKKSLESSGTNQARIYERLVRRYDELITGLRGEFFNHIMTKGKLGDFSDSSVKKLDELAKNYTKEHKGVLG